MVLQPARTPLLPSTRRLPMPHWFAGPASPGAGGGLPRLMSFRQPIPGHLRRSGFTVASAYEAGLTKDRLAGEDLDRPFQGVRRFGSARDQRSLALAYASKMRPDEVFSHVTAATLLGMRIPAGIDLDRIHVTSFSARRPRARGVIGHRASRASLVTSVSGLRTTTPVRTWLDLAAEVDERALVVLGDGLVRRVRPVATVAELEEAVRTMGNRPGVRKLVRALARIRPGTDSPRETDLRLLLVDAGAPEPEVNGAVPVPGRLRPFHGDLVFRSQRVIVEYDGRHHEMDADQHGIDIRRLNALAGAGWTVIRVDRHLMRDARATTATVISALRVGGAS